ncbi:unnamed protein product [Moneuplotes crassus]|uniref:Uncharacterized protein n=1 Tax=Euplotes crassus TaxID=5936 RepID=A0AAD1XL41_EUPCR|nr:unnamed protein product [Moneuplotes crassus]
MLAEEHYSNCNSSEVSLGLQGWQIHIENSFCKCSLNYEYYTDLNWAKKASILKFYKPSCIDWLNMERRNKHVQSFLLDWFPEKLNDFNVSSERIKIASISLCFSGIIRNSSKVLNSFTIHGFRVNLSQFKRLIASFSQVKTLKLSTCKISLPTSFTFPESLPSSKISELDLFASGSRLYSDWKNNPEQFRNLIQGLATYPGFKMSLYSLHIEYCRIKGKDAENILIESGLEGTKVYST